jgi:peptide/nickel transport system ATP-binding protein
VLEVEGLSVAYGGGAPVVRDVSFALARGETLALVGESGSGKSTIARAVAGLVAPAAGRVALGGRALAPYAEGRSREDLRRLQLVFQNPDASLNPRARVGGALRRPLDAFFGGRGGERIGAALAEVRLDEGYARRFPDQLSGGERQRVAIARALLAEPDVLLCDEVLSALDVSVQANVLETLTALVRGRGLAMLFISHDLAVVRMVADRIVVLFGGEVVEAGPARAVLAPPCHPFTAALLDAAPVPLRPPRGAARPAARPAPPAGVGCVHAGRCAWRIGPVCDEARPPWHDLGGGHRLGCHHSPAALTSLWQAGQGQAQSQARTA